MEAELVKKLSSLQVFLCLSKLGMHNIRPAEAFNLAREPPNFVSFVSFLLLKTPFECVKTYQLWLLDKSKKNFGPPRHEI